MIDSDYLFFQRPSNTKTSAETLLGVLEESYSENLLASKPVSYARASAEHTFSGLSANGQKLPRLPGQKPCAGTYFRLCCQIYGCAFRRCLWPPGPPGSSFQTVCRWGNE